MGIVGKRYSPWSVVVKVKSPCSAGLVAVTTTRGIAAPVASVTLPVTAPILMTWPAKKTGNARKTMNKPLDADMAWLLNWSRPHLTIWLRVIPEAADVNRFCFFAEILPRRNVAVSTIAQYV